MTYSLFNINNISFLYNLIILSKFLNFIFVIIIFPKIIYSRIPKILLQLP